MSMAEAMKLRAQELSATQFRQQALELKVEIKALVHSPAQHPGIQKIQNIFRDRATRLYHWAKNPAIPADNNRAESCVHWSSPARSASVLNPSKAL
jgi:hypothetical protein